MQRYCVCGKKIAGARDLCNECYSIYGRTASDWPAWLRFWINDTHREQRTELEIDKHEISFTDCGWDQIN